MIRLPDFVTQEDFDWAVAEDLLEFMDTHGIGKANILGFSDGGNIAMVFALTHPERVS
ncbi:MAG: alpha/beta fold hydrolase [Bacteroidales bacterium]|nr:alpha/beta fold hydrolase [Bacteroidales bacterium]